MPNRILMTAAQLREPPTGFTIGQHCDLIRAAMADHRTEIEQILRKSMAAGRDKMLAREQADYDAAGLEFDKLNALLEERVNSPEGQRVDYTTPILSHPTDDSVVWSEDPMTGRTSRSTGTGYHTGGGHTYQRDDVRSSWVRDIVAANLRSDPVAAERLRANNREVETEHRALSTGAGAGGEWVPPLWLISEGLKLARAGRVIADQINHMPLPAGTDSISLPRMATGTAVAEQVVQNTQVQNTDATTEAITADVATIAGQQVISLQLIEQSPVPVDQLVLQDLFAALATKTDQFAISNNATNKVGLINVAGINTVTYTDATPTVSELYPKIADAIQQIHTTRFLPPSKIFMHPRRWAWMTAASDTAGRPLVVPSAQMPQNAMAAMGNVISEGFVGSLQGLPVFVDPNLATNLGAGTNEDRIVIVRAEDLLLMESVPRANAYREPLAAQLSVLLVLHNYVAVQMGRYPKSIAVISGTGLTAPTF